MGNQEISDEEGYDTMYLGGDADDEIEGLVDLQNLCYETYDANY